MASASLLSLSHFFTLLLLLSFSQTYLAQDEDETQTTTISSTLESSDSTKDSLPTETTTIGSNRSIAAIGDKNVTGNLIPLDGNGTTLNNNSLSPGSGDLHTRCFVHHDCRVNGSQCDLLKRTCECKLLLIETGNMCVLHLPISHRTVDIFNFYVDLAIGAVIILIAIGSFFAPSGKTTVGRKFVRAMRNRISKRRNTSASI